VNRGFDHYNYYHFNFSTTGDLDKVVASLPAGSTWIDMGTGRGNVFNKGLLEKIRESMELELVLSDQI